MTYFLILELLILLWVGNLLIFKRVGRNSLIGYRTSKSLDSDENWFKYNKVLGYNLLACSVAQLSSVLFYFNSLDSELIQGVIGGGLPVLAVASTYLIIKFKFK